MGAILLVGSLPAAGLAQENGELGDSDIVPGVATIDGEPVDATIKNPPDDDVTVTRDDGTIEFTALASPTPIAWHAVSVDGGDVVLDDVERFDAALTGRAYRAIKIDTDGDDDPEYAVVQIGDQWRAYDYDADDGSPWLSEADDLGSVIETLTVDGLVGDSHTLTFDAGIGLETYPAGASGTVDSMTITTSRTPPPGGGDPGPGQPDQPQESVEQDVPAGGQVSTDPDGVGPTPDVPATATVTTPNEGAVSIDVQDADDAPAAQLPVRQGIQILDTVVIIEAPDASADEPLNIRLGIHQSQLPDDAELDNLLVFRNGEVVPLCAGSVGVADPDPCVADIDVDVDGNLVVELLTSTASVWSVAAATSPCPVAGVPDDPFSDNDTGTHRPSTACAAWWGLAEGFADGTFGAAIELNRGQGASFIARLLTRAGVDLPVADPPAFDDVGGTTHETAINQLAEAGIVNGVDGERFEPEATLTRAQMATLLVHAYEHVGGELPAGDDTFEDDDRSVHEDNINKAAAAAFTRGVTADRFDPGSEVTRGQMVSFLVNVLERFYDEGEVTLPR